MHPSESGPDSQILRASASRSKLAAQSLHFLIPSTSTLNPFFGYPTQVSLSGSQHTLHHGRRRKRDLVRTLLVLLWLKWRRRLLFCLSIIAVLYSLKRLPLRTILAGRRVLWNVVQ